MAALTRDGPVPGPDSAAVPWEGSAGHGDNGLGALAGALADGTWDVVLLAPGTGAAVRAVELVAAHDSSLPVVVAGATGERQAARLVATGARDALVGRSLARLGPVVAREAAVARLRRDWARVRDAEARLARVRRRQVRAVAAAREGERRRLGRELHDELGQLVTGIRLEAAALARSAHRADATAAAEAAGRIEGAAARVAALLGARLRDLDPPDLAPHGLVAALRARVAAWEREAGVPCILSVVGPVGGLEAPVKLAAYRVVQEALTNAARHARASRVRVRVGRLPGTLGRGDMLEVSVEDDGAGPRPGPDPGRGLAGLRERVAALDGELSVTAGPHRGTRVTARLPIFPIGAPRRGGG
jgi:two-component system, NarL family, sensor histidine kinase UhpB